jgi:hypothetical protein
MAMVFKAKVNYYYEFIHSQEILGLEGQHERYTSRRGKNQQ